MRICNVQIGIYGQIQKGVEEQLYFEIMNLASLSISMISYVFSWKNNSPTTESVHTGPKCTQLRVT